ncbi:RES family NAD+ phosphorylase [Rufibacter latericius]|uniref:RES domain-containing protein n=1 Tax=Rufibacter latericius TaxID=2487040 RepID=A0A3M9MAQ0_9BACT|nr:RES family NAD+ phosphorylase [Rufibacter latericius]RNI22621.1 RES domain-containing protein [Rufibacter latericius]
MADFNKAFEQVNGHQESSQHNNEHDESGKTLLCSNCFQDEGLKIDANKIGFVNNEECPNCKSRSGHKLTKDLVHTLCYRFFVRGTIHKCDYGGSPLIQYNEQHYNLTNIDVSPWLENDVKLIEQAGKIGLFYYGPRLWMLGEIEPLKSLQIDFERKQIVDRILNTYPVRELNSDVYFYRLRLNPNVPHEVLEYDTPPDQFLGGGRLDDSNFPVLYGSPDLELCLHECRTSVEDDIFAAKLVPTQNLKVLDLSSIIDEDTTEFESLDLAIHFLFLAGKHSYAICRQIAFAAKENGFDGLIYPSYFSYIRTGHIPFDTIYGITIRKFPDLKEYAQSQSVPNIALFGRPINENKIRVECINKVLINRIGYDLSFGPAFHKAIIEDSEEWDDTSDV